MSMVYNHFTNIDPERKLFKCHYCSYTHMKNFSTTSNMVAHLRSRHPGIFPPIIKRRISHHNYRPYRSIIPSTPTLENLFNDEDIKPIIDSSPKSTSDNSIQFNDLAEGIVNNSTNVNRVESPDISEVIPMNGMNNRPSSSSSSGQNQQQPPPANNPPSSSLFFSQPLVSLPRSIPRHSSPPPFSHPPSTSLPLPSTPELEQLHARLMRAQIEREEAVARYYNALANRANTETSLLREK